MLPISPLFLVWWFETTARDREQEQEQEQHHFLSGASVRL